MNDGLRLRKEEIEKKFLEMVPDRKFGRLGTVFKTTNNKYFYDAGTGKVFCCEEDEYDVLKYLLDNEDVFPKNTDDMHKIERWCDIYEKLLFLCEKENILQAPLREFYKLEDKDLEVLIDKDLQQIILELTQKCNLRCKYCIYNEYNPAYRDFTNQDMDWDVAKRAIDYAREHSGKKIAVTFYGGEPLVRFDLLKKCIDYCLETIKDKELTFSLSTSLTLMTPQIAEYIASIKGCSVLCSIDGPDFIHDAYRVSADKKGTHKKAIQGLRYLVEAMGEKGSKRIIINTVVCPPYSKAKLDMIQDFFDSLEWLPSEVTKKCDYVEGGSLRDEDIDLTFLDSEEDKEDYKKGEIDSIRAWALDNVLEKNDNRGYSFGVGKDNLIRIHNRILCDKPSKYIHRNGCCIPGNRRIYVKVNGDFSLCEKVGDCPDIGNVYEGVDIGKVKKYYIEEYENKSIGDCSNCWAVNICGVCYASCCDKNGLNMEYKKVACDYQKEQAIGELMAYHQLLEDRPEEIEKIKEVPIM